jgi:TonB family protein
LISPTPVDSATTPSETQIAQQPTAALAPAGQAKPVKTDYGWLSDLMARWIEDLDKRYPVMLRAEGIHGKVTLTAVLHGDGVLSDVRVVTSSGSATLDQVAVEDVRKGSPILLSRSLERSQMPVKFSIIYELKTAQ